MHRSSFFTFVILTFLALQTPAQTKRIIQRFGIGLSYSQWNERLKIAQGMKAEEGFASYAGSGLSTQLSWTRHRWILNLPLDINFGKAAAGGFKNISFPDGVQKSWYALTLSPSISYRLNNSFAAGAGMISSFRAVNWEPEDQTLMIETRKSLTHAPAAHLKWRLFNRIEITHTMGFFGAKEYHWLLDGMILF